MTAPVKYGLYFFLVTAVITLLQYFISKDLIFNPTIAMILPLLLAITFIVLSVKEDRADEAGYTLAEGLKAGMITFGIGTLLIAVFNFVLGNVIDQSLNEMSIQFQKEISIATAETVSGWMGADDANKAAMMAELDKQELSSIFSLKSQGLGWIFGLIFPGLIISLIVGAIMKKN